MQSRVRAVLLASAALVALAPFSSAALAAASGPAPSRATVSQPLTWAIVPSPNKVVEADVLNGMSCASASACTAVGTAYSKSRPSKTLIESWNGTAWSIVPSPNPPTNGRRGGHVLSAVSCVSATACTAVGGNLAESWNGTTWSVVPSPTEGSASNGLSGVSCTAADECTAVGEYGNTGGPVQTLVESWNGATWSFVPSPDPAPGAGGYNTFASVSCAAANMCTAVGEYMGPASTPKTLVESWDGAAWSIVPSPNTGGPHVGDSLAGVSCPSAAMCVAAGETGNQHSSRQRTLIELGTSSG